MCYVCVITKYWLHTEDLIEKYIIQYTTSIPFFAATGSLSPLRNGLLSCKQMITCQWTDFLQFINILPGLILHYSISVTYPF